MPKKSVNSNISNKALSLDYVNLTREFLSKCIVPF